MNRIIFQPDGTQMYSIFHMLKNYLSVFVSWWRKCFSTKCRICGICNTAY